MENRQLFGKFIVILLALTLLLITPSASPVGATGGDGLLLSEVVVTPTVGEYVEIHNPTGTAIDLTDVYLTDATFSGGAQYYYKIVEGVLPDAGGGGFSDFHARFPTGASIGPGEYQTIAMAGSDDFNTTYGMDPTYELFEDGASADAIPDMLEALPGSINNQGGLSDSGEVVILYSWDGNSDLVSDLDYALWGDKAEAVDKTGVSIDGPDADTTTSTYLPDTVIASQDIVASGSHSLGDSFQRIDIAEGSEGSSGGNGVTGDDETSENLSVTWSSDKPATPGAAPPGAPTDHLLLSEIVVTLTEGEYVEIHNPSGTATDLTDVYLTDATFSPGGQFYYNIVTGSLSQAGGGGFGDFHARFPAGASIGPGEYQTVALSGSDNFGTTYGISPTYELFEDATAADGIPDMLEALPGSINGQGGLSNAGEVVILYTWDGASDLVSDLDYAVWGDKAEAVDKSGASVDGPDAGTTASTYLSDTAVASQDVVATGSHASGSAFQRVDLTEGTETGIGGNGVDGHDETSEDLSITWSSGDPPTPGAEAPSGQGLVINEIDYDQPGSDFAEFIELKNASASAIDLGGLTLQLVNGNGGAIYRVISLPAISLAAGDFYVVCADAANTPQCDLGTSASSGIQNGAPDAVALMSGSAIVDAVSYEGDTAGFTEGSGVGLADPGSSGDDYKGISRFPDGADTDMNNVDLSTRCITPGLPNSANSSNCGPPVEVITTFGVCGDQATFIHDVQGSGNVSPMAGPPGVGVVVEGVVVGDFEDTATQLSGFFLQEEDADADADVATSEGIFVFNNGFGPGVNAGDVVRVQGNATEFFDLTELNSVSNLAVCSAGGIASPSSVALPVASFDDLESVEGMAVHFSQTLYASGNFNQGRFGEVDLSANGPLDNPTNVVAPGAAANALQAQNNLSRIQLDDGSNVQNPLPLPPYIGAGNTLRTGDTTSGLTGVLGYSFGVYEVHPTQTVSFTRVNTRPLTPPDVGGDVTVAAFNVLNYFTTLTSAGNVCGPLGDQGCRGANNPAELAAQRAKIVDALATLEADVVGLMEIENPRLAATVDEAVDDLVAGLNSILGAGTYDYIDTGTIGDDAIKVALIYKPGVVTPAGAYQILDESVDSRFNDDKNRPMLTQAFEENATGEVFTVAVNHLKSKGSDCNALGDPDAFDGQGNCNLTRMAAAEAIADWLATDPTGSGSPHSIVIGDLNSYAMEDPIVALKLGGYTDLIQVFQGIGYGNGSYSFNFQSQSGYLDHAMSSQSLTSKVTGAAFWHINADEPSALDYNDFNQPALYNADPFRSSDHDPVIVGLDMATIMGLKEKTRDDLASLLPTGNHSADRWIMRAIASIDRSLNPDLWIDEDHLSGKGWLVFIAERRAVHDLSRVWGSAETAAQAAIDQLLQADEMLAQTALDLAIVRGGDSKEIHRAQKELARAAAFAAKGKLSQAVTHYGKAWFHATKAVEEARFATFNASLNRSSAGALAFELTTPGSAQPATIAEIIQRTRPEVLLINEFDFDPAGTSATLFQRNYLSVSQGGADPIEYPYRYVAPSNTGIFSGFDLDNSGVAGDFVPNDSFGFGFFEGQFGMAVFSMYPIDTANIRTFQLFLWKDMPGALLPDDPAFPGPADWYSPAELDVFRLSSKSHWDVPIQVGFESIHFLASHPTPPVFDGPEDRNGTRNFDEIRFWADYIDPDESGYIYDDNGESGGLHGDDLFVIAGDQNSDPLDGDSIPGAIQQLLDHSKINTKVTPSSEGGPEQAASQGGANASHLSDPAFDTADFSDFAPGNLRADYVLPRNNMNILDAGVFWPLSTDPLFPLVGLFPFPSSDHRLVWVDVRVHGR
jgi:predicted extracellular nuclease